MKPRPGASEVYTILVPCALTHGGKHEIKLRLRLSDNRVTFEGACDWRVAEAYDTLSQGGFASCRVWVEWIRDTIRKRGPGLDLVRCTTCDAYVPHYRNDCPFQIMEPRHGPLHMIDRSGDLPFWQRIVRVGRVR